jgi:DNA repair exonuclease SbcCD ATPase subunit
MDDPGSSFRVVLRGYDPTQVNRRIEELATAVAQAAAQRDVLAARLEAAEREQAEGAAPVVAEEPTFEQLGERVGRILALAAEEADHLRRTAEAEVAAARERLEEETTRAREDAERYAAETRSAAETEAARIVEDARRAADERLDNAERDASARLQDAEAIFDEQRAKALQSAADFENTLAARRKAAEDGFQRQMGEAEQRLEEARQMLENARSESERTEAEARREAESVTREAEERAKSIVAEAETTASRLRAESDRELAAASQRRDAINAQLGNVRQMLAALTGSATPPGSSRTERRTDEGTDPVSSDAGHDAEPETAVDAATVDEH